MTENLLSNSIWPNGIKVDGEGYTSFYNLGTNKINIPSSAEEWPSGNKLITPFVYQDDKIVGFCDTKAMITSEDSTCTSFDYETIDINLESIEEGELTYNRSGNSINFDVKYKKVNTFLPSGYIPVEFLHAEIGYNTIEIPLRVNSDNKEIKITTVQQALLPTTDGEGYRNASTGYALTLGIYPGTVDDIAGNEGIFVNCWHYGAAATSSQLSKRGGMYVDPGPYYNIGFRAFNGDYDILFNNEIVSSRKDYGTCDAPYWRLFGNRDRVERGLFGKKKEWKYFENGKIKMHLIPAINPNGVVCMHDIINNIDYTPTYGTISAGLTLDQLSGLYNLPKKSSSLYLMLPAGYNENGKINKILNDVKENGWTLIINTYTEWNESQATTYSMERKWVRKSLNENGQYYDEDGNNWLVEWCDSVISSEDKTEEDMGYEIFRSVESACEYWGLTLHQSEEIPINEIN